jgi:hypothetical protein
LHALSAEAFLATSAAVAFREGRYGAAREGFEALRAEHPDDVLVLRYLGLTYDRLGKYDTALAAFDRALEMEPDSAPTHLFLGLTAFRNRDAARAFPALRRVIELAPDSPYDERARAYLSAMQQQVGSHQHPGAPRRWNLFTQVGTQYDWNIPAAPDGFAGDTEGIRLTQFLSGGYDLLHGERWRIRGELSSYHSQHPDSDFDAFDLNTIGTALALSYTGSLLGRPITSSLRYGWEGLFLDQDRYDTAHKLLTWIGVNLTPDTLTQFHYEFRTDGFREDGFDPRISSRDALVNTVGFSQYLYLDERRHYVWADYTFRHTDADGANFDALAQTGKGGASLGLPHQIRADVTVSFHYETYEHFRGTPDRRSRRWTTTAALSRPLVGGLSISLSYLYAKNNSNAPWLEYDRHLATFILGHRF